MRRPQRRDPLNIVDNRGATLVELLVVMVIMGVIGGILVGGLVSALRSAQATNARLEAVTEIENAQRRVVQDLRSATSLELAAGADLSSDLTINFRRGGSPTTVRYSVIEGDATTPAQLVREDTGQTLVTILNNDKGTAPLFTYLDARGNELDCDDQAGRACLGASRVRVTIVRDIPDRNPVRTNTEVTIRNIRLIGG